jgi:hypothetical protein
LYSLFSKKKMEIKKDNVKPRLNEEGSETAAIIVGFHTTMQSLCTNSITAHTAHLTTNLNKWSTK